MTFDRPAEMTVCKTTLFFFPGHPLVLGSKATVLSKNKRKATFLAISLKWKGDEHHDLLGTFAQE